MALGLRVGCPGFSRFGRDTLKRGHRTANRARPVIRAAVAGRRDAGPTLAGCTLFEWPIFNFSPFRGATFWRTDVGRSFAQGGGVVQSQWRTWRTW
jgi:hypothetical protein